MLETYGKNTLEDTEGAFITVDKHQHIIYANCQAEFLLQRSSAELLDKDLREIFPEPLSLALHTMHLEALETLDVIHFNAFFPALKKWFEIHAYPLQEKLFIYLADVTESKQAEKALIVSEQLKQAILDALSEHIAVLDQDGIIVAVNKAWEHYAKENSADQNSSSLGTNYLEVCSNVPEDEITTAQEAYNGIQSVLKGCATSFTLEYPCHTPTKKSWYLMSVTPLPQVKGAVVAHADITERILAEEALRTSEMQARRLLDSSIIGIVIANSECILQANDTFLKIIGLTQEDISNKAIQWKTITPADFIDHDNNALQQLKEHGIWHPFEKEYYRKDGTRVPVEIGAVKLQDDPLQWIGFILDISERKILEKRKDEFIAIASHELQTPITTLKGLTQLLKKRIEKQGEHKPFTYLLQMEAQITTLIRLVEDLLDVSKIQAGRVDYLEETVDIDMLIREVVDMLQPISTTHSLYLHGTAQRHVIGDADRLTRVFVNLITNAIKYSPQAERVDITIQASNDMVTINVQDYGIGIPRKHREQIFDRFYRVYLKKEKTAPGLGMGLYISNEIIKHYEGTITVESEEGKGSIFSVSLPLDTLT